MKPLALFILITVTNGGEVHEGLFSSLHSCQEAVSLATTGMTIEEKAQAEADAILDYRRRGRVPTAEDYQKCQNLGRTSGGSSGGSTGGIGSTLCLIESNGLAYDYSGWGGGGGWGGGTMSYSDAGQIKYARCLSNPEGNK